MKIIPNNESHNADIIIPNNESHNADIIIPNNESHNADNKMNHIMPNMDV